VGGCTSLGCASAPRVALRSAKAIDVPGPMWPLSPLWPLLVGAAATLALALGLRAGEPGLLCSLCGLLVATSIAATLGAAVLRALERLSRWLSVGP
jgi:hypothetical protein